MPHAHATSSGWVVDEQPHAGGKRNAHHHSRAASSARPRARCGAAAARRSRPARSPAGRCPRGAPTAPPRRRRRPPRAGRCASPIRRLSDAAQAGAEQQREERHRERVHRVAEQQHEALQQRDLDQHERAAEAREVGRASAASPWPSAPRDVTASGPRMNRTIRNDEIAEQHQQRGQAAGRPRAGVDRPLDVLTPNRRSSGATNEWLRRFVV